MRKRPDFLHVDTDRLMEIKSLLKNIGVGVVRNGCVHFGLRTLKPAVSQVGINGIN